MKILLQGICCFLLTSTAFAGPGHDHKHGHSHPGEAEKQASQQEIKIFTLKHIESLIQKKKVDASWNQAKFDSMLKKNFDGKEEWVITYTNPKGKKGQKLYIFTKLSGKIIAANFTGK